MKTKIKELREKRNLTQEGLAEKVDVTEGREVKGHRRLVRRFPEAFP
jgi:transcriptional regulator with XRE-family HTH domain